MHAQEADGGLTDRVARVDLVPACGELFQAVEGRRRRRRIEGPLAFEARDGRRALDSVAHHTSTTGSCAATACIVAVVGSVMSSGTIADASQNLIGLPGARRGAHV